MSRILIAILFLASFGQSAFSAACAPGTLAGYIALGTAGCTIGGNTFGSFQALSNTGSSTAVAASSVSVTPSGSPGSPGFTFLVNLRSTAPQPSQEVRFLYKVTGAQVLDSQVALSNSSATGDGIVLFIQDYCVNGTFGPDGATGCTGNANEQVLLANGSEQSSFSPAASLVVSNDLVVDGGQHGSASGGAFTNQFDALGQDCTYSVTPGSQTAAAAASQQTQTIATSSVCGWQAVSNASWLVITSAASGTGNGTVTYQIQANTAATPRTGTLTIAGQTVTITQSGTTSSTGSGPSTTVFVTSLYQDLLGRAPDSGGLNYYVTSIDGGGLTRSQAAAQFFTSPEFSSAGLYIIKLYIAVLKRDPDYAGWAFWLNSLRAGTPALSILNSFLNSPEFTTLYGNTTNATFVNLVYQNVLGRQPDTGGYNYYLNLLNTGGLSRAALMDQFIQSPEFSANVQGRAYANLLYMGFLKRTADPSGLTFWTDALMNLNNLPTAISSFITSAEYLARFS